MAYIVVGVLGSVCIVVGVVLAIVGQQVGALIGWATGGLLAAVGSIGFGLDQLRPSPRPCRGA